MNKLNFENLDLIRSDLMKINTGEDIGSYHNLSFLSHELYLYLQAWTNNPEIKWEDFKKTNHLLNNNLHDENKCFDLSILVELRNSSYYKKLNRNNSFHFLKYIYRLETSMLKENKKVYILKESVKRQKTG